MCSSLFDSFSLFNADQFAAVLKEPLDFAEHELSVNAHSEFVTLLDLQCRGIAG